MAILVFREFITSNFDNFCLRYDQNDIVPSRNICFTSNRLYIKIVAIWTMDCSHADYADQMRRSDFLNIAQTGVVAAPHTCILDILISYIGPDTVYTK